MEIGRLPDLVMRVGGVGGSVTIRPVVEEHPGRHLLSAPIEGTPETLFTLEGWEITCATPSGDLTTAGQSVTAAATAALENREAWETGLRELDGVRPMNIGRLAFLIDQLFREVTVRPLLGRPTSGTSGSRADEELQGDCISGWEISCQTAHGRFTVAGATLGEAVEAALATPGALA